MTDKEIDEFLLEDFLQMGWDVDKFKEDLKANKELRDKKQKAKEKDGTKELAYMLLQMMNEYDRYHRLRERVIEEILSPKSIDSLEFMGNNGERNKVVLERIFGKSVFR